MWHGILRYGEIVNAVGQVLRNLILFSESLWTAL